MNENKVRNYNIGLDIGTTSVGWAVLDDQYKLIKKTHNGKGVNLWGVRLFEKANPALERRLNRSTRRRYNKRRERIRLLQELMNPMIMEVDPTFFIRLKHASFLDKEDKQKELGKQYIDNYILFTDPDYNDKDYYKNYPTIYHLRQHLMNSTQKEDPRLIYLALAHMIKYRGHFLLEGQKFEMENYDVVELLDKHLDSFFNYLEIDNPLTNEQYIKIREILVKSMTRNDKKNELIGLLTPYFNKDYKKLITQLCNALVGDKFKLSVLLDDSNFKDDDGKDIQLSFSDDFDSKIDDLSSLLSDNQFDLLYELKTIYDWYMIYDWYILYEILGDNKDLSSAMVQKYEQYGDDLDLLKKVLREEFDHKVYQEFFNESSSQVLSKGSDSKVYQDVFNKNSSNKKSIDKDYHNFTNYYDFTNKLKGCTLSKLYENINIFIENLDTPEANEIRSKKNQDKFLLKQTSKDNSVIPYQLNLNELEIILDNQAQFYPELAENKDKIKAILEFRIPYYYGPLDEKDYDNHWLVKKEGMHEERIYPWNHQKVVDVGKTAEKFISRMTNYCTYFTDEPVLPKNSLIVSEYEVLNELNKIRINGKLISTSLKNRAYSELFMNSQSGKVSKKKFTNWIIEQGELLNNEDIEITGFQTETGFSTSLKPWCDFTRIFGSINRDNFDMIENIIYDLTIFNEGTILKDRLKDKYKLPKEQIQKILKLKYTGWSRLSKKLLWDIKTSYKGEPNVNIIRVMELSNMNFMQIINDKDLAFKSQIEEANKKEILTHFTYDEVKELQGSPAIKKGIWQTVQIIDEIRKIMKCDPQGVYIEFAREEQTKRRTKSRKQQLLELYESLKKEHNALYEQLKNEPDTFNDQKYLYYVQLGKCMYTGEPLEYDQVNLYETDHILPQSLIKDDSLENRVLVKKLENQYKSDDLTLSSTIRNRMDGYWKILFDHKLITYKKFHNLTRAKFEEKDIERFINRQLVETRQITKHVTQLVDNHLPNTKVYTIRANLSHDFRNKYTIYKNRNLNDFHHAHDAYIAGFLGTYVNKRYPNLEKEFTYGSYTYKFSKNKNTNKGHGFILNSLDEEYIDPNTGEYVWIPKNIDKIRKCFNYKDCFVTKKLEEFDGALFNLTVLPNSKNNPKGKTEAKIPVNKHRADVEKYGGFSGLNPFALAVEGDKVGKKKIEKIRVVENLPLVFKNLTEQEQIAYLYNNGEKMKGLKNIHIIKPLKKNQLFELNGGYYYLASASEWNNAIELILSLDSQKKLFDVNKAISRNDYKSLDENSLLALFDEIVYKMEKHYPLLINATNLFKKSRDKFNTYSILERCDLINKILYGLSAGKEYIAIQYKDFKLSAFGRLNGKTTCLDEIILIDQSITGYYERRYKL